MGKSELIKRIQVELNISQPKAKLVVNKFLDILTDGLKNGEEINLLGIGILKPKELSSRIARNPSTGEKVTVPARKSVKFKIAKPLKDALNS